ncbi:MAG: tRNA (N(6)-L-threonylcarbamoyladenosine(37)-C(2))-methylthiotransferase MtaB [Alphaproteobacteria bacterium]|nr:tRNA (N(6)-L-threonylcarbamoyladenosine(37)-C(2))-methylthiotransferase MtaB [Alphaproteobacteria bacterium]
MTGVEIVSFGCRLNALEAETMRALARDGALDGTVVVNTCAVTAEAERQGRQTIRRLRRERADARIVVTGCAAQIDPARYAAMPEVDHVIGNDHKLSLDGLGTAERVRVNDAMTLTETGSHLTAGFAERARAFVQVQNGCDHRCTFCVIPFGRGPSRSVPVGAVVEAIKGLVARGIPEIVLTGVDITAYGHDLAERPTLGALVRAVLDGAPALARLRLTSLDGPEIGADLIDLIASEPRLMPHVHLSLQAGNDLILKRMKRRHARADAVRLAERLRRARGDVALGADLIAGFPTETEAQFADTLALVADCGLVHLHVFPYSARPGTAAARMPQVDVAVRRDRAARLRAAGGAALARYAKGFVGATVRALVEDGATARTDHYVSATLERLAPPGTVVTLAVTGAHDGRLIARAIG